MPGRKRTLNDAAEIDRYDRRRFTIDGTALPFETGAEVEAGSESTEDCTHSPQHQRLLPTEEERLELAFSREFEHVDGNWPGFIYVTFASGNSASVGVSRSFQRVRAHALELYAESGKDAPKCAGVLNALRAFYCSDEDEEGDVDGHEDSTEVTGTVQKRGPTGGNREAMPQLYHHPDSEAHISLSRPFALRSHQIRAFIDNLGKEIVQRMSPNGTCTASPKYTAASAASAITAGCASPDSASSSVFVDISSRFHTLFNESRRRGFVCLPVERDYAQTLTALMHAADSALRAFQKLAYFNGSSNSSSSGPIFHVSVASFVATNAEPSVTKMPAHDQRQGQAVFVTCADVDDAAICSSATSGGSGGVKANSGPQEHQYLLCAQRLQCVECRLGNRVFRMPLPIGAASAFLEVL